MSSLKTTAAVAAATLAAVARGGNFIYQIAPQGINWEDANLFCKAKYGTLLASIHSDVENVRVYALLNGFSPFHTKADVHWIAFNDIALEDEWTNIDGTARDYVNFAPGQPNNLNGNQDCAYVNGPTSTPNGMWADTHCTALVAGFVCAAPSWITADTIASDTWILIPEAKNWYDAKLWCESQSGTTTLASVPSQAVNDLMYTAVQNRASTHAWIGFSDESVEGQWQWTDGSSFSTWLFDAGEPNNGGGDQDCAAIDVLRFGKWDDDFCGTIHDSFVCQLA